MVILFILIGYPRFSEAEGGIWDDEEEEREQVERVGTRSVENNSRQEDPQIFFHKDKSSGYHLWNRTADIEGIHPFTIYIYLTIHVYIFCSTISL